GTTPARPPAPRRRTASPSSRSSESRAPGSELGYQPLSSTLRTQDSDPPTRAIVDLDVIAGNYRHLASRVAPRAVFAVVKGDAYGHGAAAVARRLEREGAERFAVANTAEGVALRPAGIPGQAL